MKKDVMIVTGAGQIGMAIARRVGFGKKIILGDKSMKNDETIAKIMNDAGYDVEPFEMDLSSRESIRAMIAKCREYGEITMMVNGAGVSPSQAPIEAILKVALYGTAVLLEEFGKGVVISAADAQRCVNKHVCDVVVASADTGEEAEEGVVAFDFIVVRRDQTCAIIDIIC